MEALADIGGTPVEDQPYSLDLTLCDFFGISNAET
jgi:hypothetical protein